jgi:hypothetical protein
MPWTRPWVNWEAAPRPYRGPYKGRHRRPHRLGITFPGHITYRRVGVAWT